MKILNLSLVVFSLSCLGWASTTITLAQTQNSDDSSTTPQPLTPPESNAKRGILPPDSPTTLPTPSKAESDRIIYSFFFHKVANLDRVADKIDLEGKENAEYYRTIDQKGAGLTDGKGEILRQVSDECIQLLDEQDAKIKKIIDARRAQSTTPLKNALTMAEMSEFGKNRNLILDEQILKLTVAFREEAFAKLDTYVHKHYVNLIPKTKKSSEGVEPQ
jgi:hypothetical protein